LPGLAQKPAIDAAGIANAASYAPGVVAPQMLVSIFGNNFSNLTFTSTANPLPLQLNGTMVTFNGAPAPILYLSPRQINVQVPSSVQGALTADVVVTTPAGASDPATVVVSDSKAMGMFTQGSTGCGQVAAFNVHADGSIAVNTPQNSLDSQSDLGLAIFLTGLGPFADRLDGVPWQFNPADQVKPPFAALLGLPPVNGIKQHVSDVPEHYLRRTGAPAGGTGSDRRPAGARSEWQTVSCAAGLRGPDVSDGRHLQRQPARERQHS